MSQPTVNSEVSTNEPIIARINTMINEERVIKEITTVQISRLKQFDEIAQEILKSPNKESLIALLEENLNDSPKSLISRYILGTLNGEKENFAQLRSLLTEFQKAAKWTVVDQIADKILEVDENNRTALRSKVESTERLRGKKELKPYLEKLATIDRKNPDILHKYALSILEEDSERALSFLKQAAEIYARSKDYRPLDEIWNLIVDKDYTDLAFFEKIERILVANRERTRIAAYLQSLVEPYKTAEDWPNSIAILKKILEYEPTSTRARSELVRAYKIQYADHSLLNDFLKMSDLTNNKKNVGPCIDNFERNIVFDKDNYVYHRTRGVGKILSIDKDQMTIDFPNNPGQKMTIQMAISSLQPLGKSHIWVRHYENPSEIIELFEQDIPLFFEALISSFNNKMLLAEIKSEIVGRFLKPEEWSKWWNKARAQLKKSDKFGFNPKKKDEIILRDRPITQAEELIARFQSTSDWNKKLDLAHEALKDLDLEDAIHLFTEYYREQETSKDTLKKIHSYLYVEVASHAMGEDEIRHQTSRQEIHEIFKSSPPATLVKYCADSETTDVKREIVNLIIKTREDYPALLGEILFEIPIKANRYVFSELNRLEQHAILEKFVQQAFKKYRDYPEIFLWVAKSILTGQWNYEWLHATREEIVLLLFRMLKPLVQIEKKGTRLKNSTLENIFGTTNITVDLMKKGVIYDVLKDAETGVIRRMAALFREVPYVPDAHKENFVSLIQQIHPGFSMESPIDEADEEESVTESLFPREGEILVSAAGLQKRQDHYRHLIEVEMPSNSRDIGEAQEKGDLRENAEYKAAMERQQQLQAEIVRLDDELKRASVIDPDAVRTDLVTIGSSVLVHTPDGNDTTFTILGPWDADTEQNIISYVSPLGAALIGKRTNEEVLLEGSKRFLIKKISKGLETA